MIEKIIAPAGYIGIRDAVATILTAEINNQLALAISEGDAAYQAMLETFYDSEDELLIFTERTEPFDVQELNSINIYLTSINENKGSNSVMQRGEALINIDVTTQSQEGYADSSRTMQWMCSTIRGVLNSAQYQVLGYTKPSIIRRRWVTGINLFQPNETDNTSYLSGGSVALSVEYDEKNTTTDGVLCLGNDTTIAANGFEVATNGQFKLTTNF